MYPTSQSDALEPSASGSWIPNSDCMGMVVNRCRRRVATDSSEQAPASSGRREGENVFKFTPPFRQRTIRSSPDGLTSQTTVRSIVFVANLGLLESLGALNDEHRVVIIHNALQILRFHLFFPIDIYISLLCIVSQWPWMNVP